MHLSLRPVFVGWLVLLVQLPIQLFFTFLVAVFLRGWGQDAVKFFGGLAFFGIPALIYFGLKLNYDRTEYRFYGDRVEFEEGFLTISKKVIRFRDIKEITLQRTWMQRICGLGTIYLATLATGAVAGSNAMGALGFGNVAASGIGVRDIPDPDEAFGRIRALVDAAQE